MKLKELIKRIPRPDKTLWGTIAPYDIFQKEFDYWQDADWNDFEVYYTEYGSWMCTDTEVGYTGYFYEDELVAIGYKSARKSSDMLQWISQEKADKVLRHMQHISSSSEAHPVLLLEEDLEKEMGEGYMVQYSSQLMTNTLIEKDTGLPCRVIETYDKYMYGKGDNKEKYSHDLIFHGVKVLLDDGTEKILDLRTDLLVPWKIKEENI